GTDGRTGAKPGRGGGGGGGAGGAGGGGCVGARAGQGGCMGRRAGRAGRAGQDGPAGWAGPGGGRRRTSCRRRDLNAVEELRPRREQEVRSVPGRAGRVRRPGRAGWWLGRRASAGLGGPGQGRWSGRARIPGGTRTVGAGPPTGLVGGPPCEEDCSMPRNVAQKLLADHLVEGTLDPGSEIGLRVDQTLTQDATGTMVMLELEAMGLDRIRTELSVQYVDHNLLQTDEKNPDDHLCLQSAAERFGLWYSKAGNGVSHPVHQAHFGRPGALLIGSDSHTCAAGALGMLAIGVGGLEIAMAMAGQPMYVSMPEIWGVELTGTLPDWVSAKDVVLEML